MANDTLGYLNKPAELGVSDINRDRPDLVKRGWTQEMWDARQNESGLHKAFSTDSQFEEDWIKGETTYQKTSLNYNKNKGKDPRQAELDDKQKNYEAQLDAFYKHMSGPLDPNDPEVQAQSQIASNVAQRAAKLRGIKGGVVASEVGRNVANAQANLQGQRTQLGLSALGMKGQNVAGLQGMALKSRALDNDIASQQYDADVGKAQGLGGAVGGAIGGVAGGVGAYFTGDYKLVGEGIKAGSGIGASAAGAGVKRRNPGQGY